MAQQHHVNFSKAEREAKIEKWLNTPGAVERTARSLFNVADKDKNGSLDRQEVSIYIYIYVIHIILSIFDFTLIFLIIIYNLYIYIYYLSIR